MKKKSSIFRLLAYMLMLTLFSSCNIEVHTSPKVLGNGTTDMSPGDSANSSNFKIRFAYRDVSGDVGQVLGSEVVILPGDTDSANAMYTACNTSGTNCICEFFAAGSDTVTGQNVGGLTPEITYNGTNNSIICKIPPSIIADPNAVDKSKRVRLRNYSNSVATAITTITSTPTLTQLLGSLSASKMRTISKYQCNLNYIQNAGVSASPFSFTCGVGPPADLNYLQISYRYYLYADSTSNNYSTQVSDLLYNNGNSICGIGIKQLECGAPSNDFGLYGSAIGIYQKPVSLQSSPSAASTAYGYAASPITVAAQISATTLCPAGLVKKELYTTVAGAPLAAGTCPVAGTSTNISTLANTMVADAGQAVAATISMNQVTGGTCVAGSSCTAPTVGPAACDAASNTYPQAATPDPFCVIPSSYLP